MKKILIIMACVSLTASTTFAADPQVPNPSSEKGCLVEAIYHEAGNQPTAGKVAVAEVIINRRDSAQFPNTICDVVHQGVMRPSWKDGQPVPVKNMCQFSYYCDGKPERYYDGNMLLASWQAAELALNTKKILDITEGSLYYHATYVKPSWSNVMEHVVTIGAHKFYRP